ncbi:site-specific integrase [Vibrio alginolyticus]|nr:site-specific integrase [Vibrio alginolyticus]
MELGQYKTLLERKNSATYQESTAKGYNSSLNKVCADIKENFDFNKLSHCNLIELILDWQSQFSNATINNRLIMLRELCAIAHKDGLWQLNPCEGIKNLSRDQIIEKKPFTKDELRKMANTSTLQYSAKRLVFFAVYTGIRMEEAVILAWSDVNWEDGTISISRARALDYCYTPKTKQSKRVIPLTDEALELLKEQFAVTGHGPQHTIKMKDKSVNSMMDVAIDPIFIDDLTGNMFKNSKDFSQRFFTKFLQNAEIEHRGPSQLRHTFASHAFSNGVPVALIARMMGHADTKTTEAHYAQYLPCNGKEDMVRLGDALTFKSNAAEAKPSLRQRLSSVPEKIIKTYFSVFRSGSKPKAQRSHPPLLCREKKVVEHFTQNSPLHKVPVS